MARIRRNVWALTGSDDTLLWYGRAVNAMKAKPIADPTSWRYQAAIHAYARAFDPLADPADVLPSTSEIRTFWSQCQHGTWYFLPWHRIYLHHFEKIVAAEVVRLGGPAGWALPYWNYSGDDASRLLPPAFRSPTLPDGTSNGLFVAERAARCNAGQQFADANDVALRPCLTESSFERVAAGGTTSFGGGATKFEHSGSDGGTLERVPHGAMHGAVAGFSGWMGAFNTAGLDPIFWLHHANIDRLWEVWLQRDATYVNPTKKSWLTSVKFKFHDATGSVVTMTPQDVLDTIAAPLDYSYDDTSDPLATGLETAAATTGVAMAKKKHPAELVAATDTELVLGGGATEAVVPIAVPETLAGATTGLESASAPRRVYLNIENLTATGRAPAYDVYINVPQGADPRLHQECYAGRLPMFGLAEASQLGTPHSGSGLHYVLDVTDLYARRAGDPAWDANALRVSFVPVREQPEQAVRVGRVSLYVE